MTGTLFGAIGSRGVWTACLIGIAIAAAFVLSLDKANAAGADKSGECLGSPKGAPPQGERWYYRVERGSRRHCWYTRAEAPSPRKSVEKPVQPAITAKAEAATILQPAVANARAEAEPWPPAPQPAPAAPRADETENRTWTMAERWPDRAEPVQAATPLPVRMMKLQIVPAEPSTAGESVIEKLFEIIGGAVAISGMVMVLIALLRRRKRADDDDIGLPALTGPDGRLVATWYEPPMDRLRMARHLAELPRPAN